ncbi:MAG: (4Fe-4S)-binding protein [Geobacteraceae bacterium GWC2_58_44]|nr:MAG: (4Fe-4S)-binding protein [Geobacteraceae bacterium GWC2_58_44]HBG04391.1 (4Fe-4S)-binding protein [Geobacter sp.]
MYLVAVERLAEYDRELMKQALLRLLAPLGGMERHVKPGERVLIKPNLLSAKPPEAAVTTHPELLRAVIEQVQQAGGVALVGDSPGYGSARRVAERSGMLRVIEETGAQFVPFSETAPVPGKGTFRHFELARPYLEADRLINLPKLKTHEMMTMTCCVKNLFGAVVGTQKAAWHLKAGADKELFAEMLLEVYRLREPELNIVDAVVAMEGNGPGSGDPCRVGLLLAGTNAVAVDVIAAEIAGIPKQLLYLENAARKLALPGSNRDEIDCCGLTVNEASCQPLRLPHLSDVQFGLPGFLKNRLRNQFSSRPEAIASKCELCGVCVGACPPGAIRAQGGRLRFDYQRCIRCFCCRELCPHAALRLRDGWLLSLMKKMG